ncbi:MAG: cold shock domain-containing protein [Magnetococcales bacterium]|nr:cold shock domain-containing protein [Magnetococcales bacterium]
MNLPPPASLVTEPVEGTVLCARIHNADQYKNGRPEEEWSELFSGFYAFAADLAKRHGGEFVKCLASGVMCHFPTPASAVQAAIDLQEQLMEKRRYPVPGLSCGIGIATGATHPVMLSGRRIDFLGSVCDVATILCEQARGHAILLHHQQPIRPTDFPIHSRAGAEVERHLMDYFQELAPMRLSGVSGPIRRHAIHWQANPGEYLAISPMETTRVTTEEEESYQGRHYFGKVSAFKKERGFGFIQYYGENNEYQEVYFHMTYVVHQVPVLENDHVQFIIRPGKEGRPQACSVLVLGGRFLGRVESCAENGTGFITIRDHDSKIIRFFVLPQEVRYERMQVDDVVEFTAGSGSESEGLVALQITHHQDSPSTQGGEPGGENLVIGALEHAVVTVYFPEKGYGFAKCKRNSVYIHVSELTEPEQVPGPGDLIEFEVFPGRNDTYRANNVRLIKKKGLDL